MSLVITEPPVAASSVPPESTLDSGVESRLPSEQVGIAPHEKRHVGPTRASKTHLRFPDCSYTATRPMHLRLHRVRRHGDDPANYNLKIYTCPKCDYETCDQSNMKRHMIGHDPKKRIQCPECDKSYTQVATMFAHRRAAHGGTRFHCPRCAKSFKFKSGLTRHQSNCKAQ